MTYTAQVKEEITSSPLNEIENRNLFLGYLYANSEHNGTKYTISLENLAVAQKLFKTIKYCYHMEVKMTIRTIKRFKVKKVFIFEIEDKDNIFEKEIAQPFDDDESLISFIKGLFLATGSINDPKKNNYHLEMSMQDEKKAQKCLDVLQNSGYNFKMLKRENSYMVYLKSSEEISDFLKLIGAINSLFYFEDIRIFKDHTNMVNRLNNCEQANLEKALRSADKQIEIINYIKDNDYMSLLDDKTKEIAEYRLKYPEESFQSLSDIISKETGKKVTKSYVNHHFRKINDIYKTILESLER